MSLREIFKISRGTKVIAGITFSVSVSALIFAWFYYGSINNSEDPRILRAREYLTEFDKKAGVYNSIETFPLLDSAKAVFNKYPDYKYSYEPGVIYNNKSSSLLLMALYDSTLTGTEKLNLLSLAMKFCDSSIVVYKKWLAGWGTLNQSGIETLIRPFMKEDDKAFSDVNFEKVFKKRVKDIVMAQTETPRRLSVALTNKGTIYRHLLKPDSALTCFSEALSLWNDNRTAKSNLSVLIGQEPLKPSVIESLFPPDRNKK